MRYLQHWRNFLKSVPNQSGLARFFRAPPLGGAATSWHACQATLRRTGELSRDRNRQALIAFLRLISVARLTRISRSEPRFQKNLQKFPNAPKILAEIGAVMPAAGCVDYEPPEPKVEEAERSVSDPVELFPSRRSKPA